MTPSKLPWESAGLPGQPTIKDSATNSERTVSPSRVIRCRDGKPLLLRNAFDGQAVAASASKFLGKAIHPVHFGRISILLRTLLP